VQLTHVTITTIKDDSFVAHSLVIWATQVRTTALASESTVAQMARLVEQAAAAQSPTETLVQRFARVYTPLVLLATACVAFVPFAAARTDHKVCLTVHGHWGLLQTHPVAWWWDVPRKSTNVCDMISLEPQ